MSFNSLDRILKVVEGQPSWQNQLSEHRRLLQCWETIVASSVALHTRPLYIARNVLYVATSSSAWAQTLSCQRYSLLQKLNSCLPEPLQDLRFSSAQWHSQARSSTVPPKFQTAHPSWLEAHREISPAAEVSSQQTPQAAFERWVQVIEARSHHLPLCPQCQCPTPEGELQRWTLCAQCMVKQWSSEG